MSEEEIKFTPVSQEVQAAVAAALGAIEDRSFSGRHPELGKMIKCPVCRLRHRDAIKCGQRFTELYIEEDLETGIKTTVFALAPQTRNGIVGAAQFKGKRIHPHPNRTKLMFIERVREVFPTKVPDDQKEFQDALKLARKIVGRQLRKEARQEAKKYRRQQDISRRINRGLASPGSR